MKILIAVSRAGLVVLLATALVFMVGLFVIPGETLYRLTRPR